MTINQFFSVIFSRKRLLIVVFISVIILVTVVSFLLPKQYVAEADIAVDAGGSDPVSSLGATTQMLQQQNYLGTQAGILSSHNTAKKVVEALKLTSSNEIKAKYQKVAGQDLAGIDDWLSNILLKDLTVEAGKDSNIIHLSFKSVDPYFAAVVTNGFIDAYKHMVIESKAGIASQNEVFFKSQIDKLKDTLEKKQKALSDYQKEHGVIATTDERIDLENQKMVALAAQVASAQSDYITARSQLGQDGKSAAENMTNPVMQQFIVQLVEEEKILHELGQKEGPNHPAYRQAAVQVAAIQAQIHKLKEQYSAAQANMVTSMYKRLQDQQDELAHQKQKVLDMKDKQAQMDIMQRGIDNEERNYNMVMQKWSEAVMQANANLTNITVLQNATPPVRPSSPNIVFNIFISLFLGFFLGAAINYILDMLDRKVRCTDDIEVLCQIPVLVHLNQRTSSSKLGLFGRRGLAKGAPM